MVGRDRFTGGNGFNLVDDLALHVAVLREQMEGPGKAEGRGFMTGGDEGQEIVDDFRVAHHAPRFRIFRFEQHGNQIVPLDRILSPFGNDGCKAGAKIIHRRARLAPARMRKPLRCAQHGECEGPARGFQIIGDALLDAGYIDAVAAGHHGFDDDIEGRPHHLMADIDVAGGRCVPALLRAARGVDHDRQQFQQLLVPECCGDGLPLPLPVIAIGRQKSLAERGAEGAAHIFALAEQMGVLDKRLMNKRGIGKMNPHDAAETGKDRRLAENFRRQSLQRIADERQRDAGGCEFGDGSDSGRIRGGGAKVGSGHFTGPLSALNTYISC